MKKLFLIPLIFLVPVLVWGQGTLSNNSTLSQIASNSSLSKRQLISSITGKLSIGLTGNIQQGAVNSTTLSALPSGGDPFISLVTGTPHPTNTAIIDQVGNNNLASVNQTLGTSNLAVLKQAGNYITTLVNQVGSGNVYGSDLAGNNHYLNVSQIGMDNLYLLEYNSSVNLNHTVQQIGNNLEAIQVGTVSKPFSITEQGVGMKILIQHYKY